MPPLSDDLWTLPAIAAVAERNEKTIRRWIDDGRLPAKLRKHPNGGQEMWWTKVATAAACNSGSYLTAIAAWGHPADRSFTTLPTSGSVVR
jgi:hypothetical protein